MQEPVYVLHHYLPRRIMPGLAELLLHMFARDVFSIKKHCLA